MTGVLKFDAEGFRSSFDAELLELTVEGLAKVGVWSSSNGLSIDRRYVETEAIVDEWSLKNKTFVVLIALVSF